MTALYLFGSTFVLVFALGFQSLNVNGGHYWLAFFTSFAIGAANLVLYKLAPNANVVEMGAFLLGGPFGIVASMWAHQRFVRPRQLSRTEKLAAGLKTMQEACDMVATRRVVALRTESRMGEPFGWNSQLKRRQDTGSSASPRPPGVRTRRDD